MHDVGPLGAIEPRDVGYSPRCADQSIAAPPPPQRAQPEPFAANALAMRLHPCRDNDLETGVARRPRHRQAVRPEIPILGDEEEQLGTYPGAGGCHSGIGQRARPGIHKHGPLEYGFRASRCAPPRNDDLRLRSRNLHTCAKPLAGPAPPLRPHRRSSCGTRVQASTMPRAACDGCAYRRHARREGGAHNPAA